MYTYDPLPPPLPYTHCSWKDFLMMRAPPNSQSLISPHQGFILRGYGPAWMRASATLSPLHLDPDTRALLFPCLWAVTVKMMTLYKHSQLMRDIDITDPSSLNLQRKFLDKLKLIIVKWNIQRIKLIQLSLIFSTLWAWSILNLASCWIVYQRLPKTLTYPTSLTCLTPPHCQTLLQPVELQAPGIIHQNNPLTKCIQYTHV